ncbi:3-oxoacyl-[acyl-carrier-protein] synthase III C-terminal domain-containing protein [Aerococcaceae bacterium WGS1372]
MNHIDLLGYGYYKPDNLVTFNEQRRYRINTTEENQITIAVKASQMALDKAQLDIHDIDLIVSANAVGAQPIPATAVLIHEHIAKGTNIPAMDINTTCTSFISAVDTLSYLIEAGRYQKVLIVSSDVASFGLNPDEKESYELFSDGSAAVIIGHTTDSNKGIIAAVQHTFSEGAHDTEIRGGLTNFHPSHYSEETKAEYMFNMHGRSILKLTMKTMPTVFNHFLEDYQINLDDIDLFIPHQASAAMRLMIKMLNIPIEKTIDRVDELGNMVSASVPYAMNEALDKGLIKKGQRIMLLGTAAGLTINVLVWQL